MCSYLGQQAQATLVSMNVEWINSLAITTRTRSNPSWKIIILMLINYEINSLRNEEPNPVSQFFLCQILLKWEIVFGAMAPVKAFFLWKILKKITKNVGFLDCLHRHMDGCQCSLCLLQTFSIEMCYPYARCTVAVEAIISHHLKPFKKQQCTLHKQSLDAPNHLPTWISQPQHFPFVSPTRDQKIKTTVRDNRQYQCH